MEDKDKTKEQLIDELAELRQRNVELKASEAEWRKTEDALRESETRFRELFDNIGSGVAVYRAVNYGEDFAFVDFNRAGERIEGTKREDLIGRNVAECFPGVKEFGLFEVFQRVWRTGTPEHHPVSLYKDGRLIGWRKNLVYKLPSGEIVAVYTDETQRKQAEEAQRESEDKYRILVENANEAILVAQDGMLKFTNPKAVELTGYSEEELTSRPFLDFVHLDDREMVAERYLKRLRGEEIPNIYSFRIINRDGNINWVDINAVLIDWMGKPATLNFLSDITERKQAVEALKESEEKYRVLVENANEGISVAQDGMLKFVNPKLVELAGHPEEELISKPFADFIHPDDREMLSERYLKRLKGEEVPHTYPYRIVDEDGNARWMEISSTLITWDGRPATLNFVSDITERKQLEEELLRIEKLESVGILAGGIAHDFNNILTGILGNISLARMYTDPDKISKRLIEAEKASIRAESLTQQLLTFSRGGAPIKTISFIAGILKDSTAFALSGSNVRFEFSVPDDLWAVEVDEGQISQVINNLIINADQAMPGGGTIKVQAENVTVGTEDALPLEDGEYVKISVQDQGIGIPEGLLQKIFDPYVTTKQKGSGLGLATCYSIISNHDGYITAKSQVGVGSTFHIHLPASPEKILLKNEEAEKKPITGKGRILVIDDDDMIRELVSDMLDSIGYEATLAIDGAQAIKLYRNAMESGYTFDAVIVDLTIPGGMGGKEAIRELKEIDPEVKAVVSSGYSTDPIMANFREYGFSDVIAKPYKSKELSEVLYRVTSDA